MAAIQDVLDLIKEAGGCGYFATVEGTQPRVRAFGFGYYEDGKFWFCTNSAKKVYAQLNTAPYAEIMFTKPDFSKYVRISGHVVFDGSLEAKTKVMEAMPGVKGLYQSPDNPIFEVFYLEKGAAVIEAFPPAAPPVEIAF
ncbi:MAG: pyridoxamine 5'-phosphate oxidase family protein [Clostridiales bacterium]|nr:pyridoxamine 5'-phosphate oxidase family protein [Clostridiales bacterium]